MKTLLLFILLFFVIFRFVSDQKGQFTHTTWVKNASKEEQFKIGQPTIIGEGGCQIK